MTVSQVHEALGSFSIKLKPNIPRDVLDNIEYFGHVAVIPGRLDARIYQDATLDAARYVGVLRKKKIADANTQSSNTSLNSQLPDVAGTSVTLEGVGMNFWLGDEDDKGDVIEDEIQLIDSNFTTAISALIPPAVTMGTVGGVTGTYSGVHQWQTSRKAIQYVCDTMSQAASPFNLLSAANSSFETSGGVGGWTNASNCNIAVTGSYSYLGTKSMIVTPTTPGISLVKTNGNTNNSSVVQGNTYVAYFWVLPTGVASTARVGVDYKSAGGGLVSSKAGDTYLALPQNAWTQVSTTFTVPSGTGITNADIILDLQSTISTDRFIVDNVWGYLSQAPTPVSFRVNNRGAIDAGPETNLFTTVPTCVLVRQGSLQGEDLYIRAVPGTLGMDQDMEDFATRVVVLGQSDGFQFSTGQADVGTISPGTNKYKDIHGNPLDLTKMVSESETTTDNADTRAELALRDIITPHREITLTTSDFDVYGSFDIGDYVYVYDPDSALVDTANEVTVRGVRINPVKLQVTESEWVVTSDYSIAYRGNDGTWYDLTDYLDPDTDQTTQVTIGNFKRTLDSNLQDVQSRVGSNAAPDNSTPAAPAWVTGSFQTVAYLDGTGLAKAQQKLIWTTPVNQDGSAISDGDHYEIQYKLNTGHLYSQTWGAVSTKQWGQLGTWAQPVQASTVDWDTRSVAWGSNTLVLNDLACGTAYDFRVRGVDKSNNLGDWSGTTTVVTSQDDIPPSQPAAPLVASSMTAIQVTHFLGQNTGGTYNLERDTAYLAVYASYEPGFTPNDSNKLGNLLVNASMLDAQTPVVQTYQTTSTVAVYVKVIAVDMSGNISNPSPAASATATLIDDAHISDLTVSKITAGEMTADWIISGNIRTGSDGQRIELNSGGIQAYNSDGDLTTNISSNPDVNNDFISWRSNTGDVLASVNSLGEGGFQDVSVANTLLVQGTDILDTILKRAKGIVAYGQWGSSTYDISTDAGGTTTGYMELSFVAEADRMYRISQSGECEVAGLPSGVAQMGWQVKYTTDGSQPTTTSAQVQSNPFMGGSFNGENIAQNFYAFATFPPGLVRLLWSFNANGVQQTILASAGPSQFWVEDMGDIALFDNVAVLNDGLGSAGSTPDTGGVAGTVSTYNCVWTRSYTGSNGLRDLYPLDRMYQGQYDGNYGQQKSLIGFDYIGIQSDLDGASIKKVELFLYAAHWFYDYGFVQVGTHNYTGIPGTWSAGSVNSGRVFIQDWSVAVGKWVDIGTDIGGELQNGVSNGIAIGPAPNTDHVYYGYFAGMTSSYKPQLRITYTK